MGGGGGIQQAQKLKQNKSSADVLLPEPKIHGHDQERGGGGMSVYHWLCISRVSKSSTTTGSTHHHNVTSALL